MIECAREREREQDRKEKEAAALTAFLQGAGEKKQRFDQFLKKLGLDYENVHQSPGGPSQKMSAQEIKDKAAKIREADRQERKDAKAV